MRLDSLRKLYVLELKDLYSAEKQLTRALPKFERAVSSADLKQALKEHIKETKLQVQRLEHLFSKLDFEPGGHRCKAMAALLREGKALIKAGVDPDVLDAGLISACQRVEHYEIAAYGTARAYAQKLGEHAAVELLQESLDEEAKADRTLTRLAEQHINFEAMVADREKETMSR